MTTLRTMLNKKKNKSYAREWEEKEIKRTDINMNENKRGKTFKKCGKRKKRNME